LYDYYLLKKRIVCYFLKEKGNKAYKKRDFEAAISHYQKATELDPNNCIYYSNLAGFIFTLVVLFCFIVYDLSGSVLKNIFRGPSFF
jgi:tetratricopeptide (TPR) repeat protein